MSFIIHVLLPFFFNFQFLFLFLFHYLLRIQKFTFFLILSGRYKSHSSLLLYEPLVRSFQVVLLILFIVCNYNFPEHTIQTFVKLGKIIELNSGSTLFFLLSLGKTIDSHFFSNHEML